ncbi:hypothetical protein U879_03135 [Defluviimonas sp. 20V17]|nr:hypothetical protein U879_03135 [Defluviimonas sp. 20V17]
MLADHVEEIGLVPVGVSEEYRYASLPLCVIDAVFSISVKYTSTQATVARFCDKSAWPQFAASRDERGAGSHSLSDLLDLYDGVTSETAAETLFGNRQRTSTTSGILKAEAVKLFAEALLRCEIERFTDITPNRLELAEAIILGLPGQGSGIAFDYFRMLAGDDDIIKPDRMIQRFVARALGMATEPGPRQAAILVRLAARELTRRGHHWTPLNLDHAIWQHQRGQRAVAGTA